MLMLSLPLFVHLLMNFAYPRLLLTRVLLLRLLRLYHVLLLRLLRLYHVLLLRLLRLYHVLLLRPRHWAEIL